MAKPRWATALAAVVRPVAIILGATFAIHRLANRLEPADTGPGTSSTGTLSAFPERLLDALTPEQAVVEAAGRTVLLTGSAGVVAVLVGWAITALRSRLGPRRHGGTDRPVSDRWSGLGLAIAVPGLTWLPLHRLAVDRGAIPEQAVGPLDGDGAPLRSMALWAVLLGLSLAPTIAAARSGGRPWTLAGSGGHPALGPTAARPSSGPLWRVGFPAITFGVSLALAEVTASTGGLIDRFIDAIEQGRPDDLLGLATPAIVAGALLIPAADIGASILHRVERPNVPGSDRVRPGPAPALMAIGLVVVVVAAAIAGLVTGGDVDAGRPAFAGPSLGGPWLGTDELGRSVAARTATALGATLAGSVIPALVATVVGAGLAFFRRTQRPASQSAIDVVLDLVSWPAMLIVPLVAWPVAGTERSLLDPVVLQITGLLLVPMATRLLVQPARGAERVAKLVATAAVVAGSALAIQLLTGFVVPLGQGARPGLGHLAAAGFDNASSSPWPLTWALTASAAAGAALYWSVGALSRVGRTMPRTDDDEGGWSADNPDGALLTTDPEGWSAEMTELAPPRVTLADDDQIRSAPLGLEFVEPAEPLITAEAAAVTDVPDAPELFPASDITVSPAIPAIEPPAPPELPTADEPPKADEPPALATTPSVTLGESPSPERLDPVVDLDEQIDIRDDITVGSAVDVPVPDDSDGDRGEISIEDEATQTVELRPSDLRRAGVQPDPD